MEPLEKVIHSYGIQPNNMTQVTASVYRVEDGYHVYAVKKSRLTKELVPSWENVFHEAYHYKLATILPVYLTRDQSLFKEVDGSIYYVSPWIDEQEEMKINQLYKAIAKIHNETKQYKTVNKDALIPKFESYETYCGQMHEQLKITVEQFEAQHFMSPLALQVCTHFRDIELALHILQKRIQEFIKELEQAESSDWGFSLCHGQLSHEHFLTSQGNHYLMNWEQSTYQYPFMDLIDLFKHELQLYHAPRQEMIQDFTVYMETNELTLSELHLMLIYLLDPTKYLADIDQYHQQKDKIIELTKSLQRQYRIIRFAIDFSHFIEQEYERSFNEPEPTKDQSHSK